MYQYYFYYYEEGVDMKRYIFHRLLLIIPTLLGVSFIVYGIISMTPGDPASAILGTSATQEQIDQLNEELGYNQPLLIRYCKYMYNLVFRLDMGRSYRSKTPVWSEIVRRVPVSLQIALNGMLCATILGIPLGILSAVRQYSVLDFSLTTLALMLAALPSFWLGMMLMLIFALKLGWFPSSGIDTWRHYILPMFAIGFPYAAYELRFTRSTMLEAIRQDYVRTCRAKGGRESIVICKHALKNALLPVITVTGTNFGGLLGGAMITETVFSIPGLGMQLVNAIRVKDVPIVMGTSLFISAFFCLIMLVVDILYAMVDPRIKAKYTV